MNTKNRGWEFFVKPVHLAVCLLFGVGSSHAAGPNLIVNGGFENNPPSICGDNFGWRVSPWMVGGAEPPNVVRVDEDKACLYDNGGPKLDAEGHSTGTPQHYLDIPNGDNTLTQTFTVPSCGLQDGNARTVTFSGAFSIRDNSSGKGSITIFDETTQRELATINTPDDGGGLMLPKNAAGAVVSSRDQVWRTVSASVAVVPGHKITYRVNVTDKINFDNAQLSFADFVCPSTNVTLVKQWNTGLAGDSASISVDRVNNGNVANLTHVDSLDSTADSTGTNSSVDGTPFVALAGDEILIKEHFPAGQLTAYQQTLSCTNAGITVGGDAQSGFIIRTDPSAPPKDSTCTLVNTALPSLIVHKQWLGAQVGDAANLTVAQSPGGATAQYAVRAVAEASDATGVTQFVSNTPLAPGAHTINLSEVVSGPAAGGAPAVYDTAIQCTNAAAPVVGGVVTLSGTPGATVCTVTNTVASLKISKAAGAPADANRSTIVGGAGDTVHYGFTVTNTGRSTLTNVAVSDPLVGAIPDTSYVWPDSSQPGVLLAGQTATVMALYTITATATGATPNSQRVTSMTTASAANVAGVVVPEANASRETAVQAPAPRLSIVKTASVADTNKSKVSGDAGDVISYQIKVANAGNVSVSGVTIADPLPGLSALSIQWPNAAAPGTLAVGEAAIATATYTITAADVKVGKVSNTATASVPGGLLTPDSVTEPVDSVSGTADTVIAHVPTDTVADAASIPTLGIGR